MSAHRQLTTTEDSGSDEWTSSGDSDYTDSDSSVPEWDPDISEDGELLYMKYKEVTPHSASQNSQDALLDDADSFKNRNNFKRSSTRRASKGKIFRVLRRQTKKSDTSKQKKSKDNKDSLSGTESNSKNGSSEITIQIDRNRRFHSEKNCQLEILFGLCVNKNGGKLIITNFLPEAKHFYEGKIKKGYYLKSINGHNVSATNLHNIIDKLKNERQSYLLAFETNQESLNIEFKNLLSCRPEHEFVLTQVLRDSFVSVIYLCCDVLDENSSNDQGVLYYYPRPYSQNFLYNSRGAFVTLNHLCLKSLKVNSPCCTTVMHNNLLINVTYTQRGEDLMLIAVPNNKVNMFEMKMATCDIVRLIEFQFGSLRQCFSDREKIYKVDHLLSRFFAMLLCGFDKDERVSVDMNRVLSSDSDAVAQLENVMCLAHQMHLPREARLQIDDALSELEAADYREWTDDPLNCQRLFVVIGCCLYFSGHLLSSHLQDGDLRDVHAFLRTSGLLKLSRTGRAEKAIVWREVYIDAYRRQVSGDVNDNEYRIPEGRWFLLVIVKGNFILASIMEAGGCTEELEGHSPPSPFYVEECESCLTLLTEVGLSRFLSAWLAGGPMQTHPQLLMQHTATQNSQDSAKAEPSKSPKQSSVELQSILKRRHNSSDQLHSADQHRPEQRSHSQHSLHNQWYGATARSNLDVSFSEDSNSQLSSSDLAEERVLGRRADRERTRRDSSGSDSEWEGQGDSRTSGSLDMSEMRKSLFDDIEITADNRLTAGEENVLFHYVQLEQSKGILLAPVKDLETATGNALYSYILNAFRSACQKIHVVLQNTMRFKSNVTPASVNKSLVAIREHGLLLKVPQPLLQASLGRKTQEEYRFWVVGRLFNDPEPKELYVCYHDSVPQDILEVAFKLSHLQ